MGTYIKHLINLSKIISLVESGLGTNWNKFTQKLWQSLTVDIAKDKMFAVFISLPAVQ